MGNQIYPSVDPNKELQTNQNDVTVTEEWFSLLVNIFSKKFPALEPLFLKASEICTEKVYKHWILCILLIIVLSIFSFFLGSFISELSYKAQLDEKIIIEMIEHHTNKQTTIETEGIKTKGGQKTMGQVYQIRTSDKMTNIIDELKKDLEIDNNAEIFRQSVTYYRYLVDQVKQGNDIIIKDKNGSSKSIIFPDLSK